LINLLFATRAVASGLAYVAAYRVVGLALPPSDAKYLFINCKLLSLLLEKSDRQTLASMCWRLYLTQPPPEMHVPEPSPSLVSFLSELAPSQTASLTVAVAPQPACATTLTRHILDVDIASAGVRPASHCARLQNAPIRSRITFKQPALTRACRYSNEGRNLRSQSCEAACPI